jgi:hypothetical protein
VISRAWLQLASRDWNAVFQSTDRLPFSAIEFHRLNLWKNHLHFLLWGLRATCLAHSAATPASISVKRNDNDNVTLFIVRQFGFEQFRVTSPRWREK